MRLGHRQIRVHRRGRRRAAAAGESPAFPKGSGYGGFPVSGIWLRCDDPAVNKRHHAKVYGKAAVGSPPMSVPHLDTRVIGEQHSLLFGPYAGFSSKFLKHGSLLDLVESVRPANVKPLISVARDNFDLTEYLVEQVLQPRRQPPGGARRVLPEGGAKGLAAAGRRTARPDHQARRQARRAPGVRHRARRRVDNSLVALLGASPGASTAAFIAISVLQKCFKHELTPDHWQPKLKEMIRSYGESLIDNADLVRRVRADTAAVLRLENV